MNKSISALFICVYSLLGILPLMAQHTVALFQPYSWEQASLIAARENKLILVEVGDVNAKVEKSILNNQGLANFLLRNVIAMRIDVNTLQGQEFLPRLLLNQYPTFAFFMPYGDLLETVNSLQVAKDPLGLQDAFRRASDLAAVKRSNSRAIRFGSMTLQEAQGKAAKEEKLIFIDVYADQNQACLLMEKNVFNLDRVADFYNSDFVSLRVNAKDAGDLIGRYEIKSFPAFLFLNSDGKLLYKAGGYSPAEQLIGFGQAALEKAKGISFIAMSQEEAIARSKQDGKLVFTDFYTPGGAHKEMVQTVFADPDVTDLFTGHFVNVSTEAPQSVLVFSDSDGRELHRVTNIMNADDLLDEARKALQGKGTAGMRDEYEAGNRNPEFMEAYTVMLWRADRKEDASRVASGYLAALPHDCLKERRYWDFFYQYVGMADSGLFDYVLQHRKELYALYGEDPVRRKIASTWIAGAEGFVKDGVFDEIGFREYVKRLKKEKVEGWRLIVRNARMHAAEKTGDWRTYVELAEEKWNEEQIPDAELYSWGITIERRCHDEAIRFKAAKWFAEAALEMERKEQITGKIKLSSYKGFFEKLVNDLVGKK